MGFSAKAYDRGGRLIICGGGEMEESVYDEFVEQSGGQEARIVLIPTAYEFDDPGHVRRYYAGWLDYEVKSFDFLDTDSRDEADTDRFIRPIEQATGVWIGGGDQGRLADLYGGTKVEAALRRLLERGGVIGGTSAGASIMAKQMIRSGRPTKANLDDGFGFLSRTVIDQHVLQRGRHTRLLGVMKAHPDLVAMGLDEGSAVLVQKNQVRVLGDTQVTIGISRFGGRVSVLYHLKPSEEATVIRFTAPGTEGELGLTLRTTK